ncbi:cytochrome P450 [Schizophyllum commune]
MSPQSLADSSSTTYLVGGALLLVYLASLAIYRLFLSPLSNIPGPWYAAVTDLWLTSHIARLQQCMTVHKLFEAYGPIVRIGPNRIAFKDTAGVKAVYSVLKFDKGPSYLKLKTADDADQAMTILEHGPHSARRRSWASHYTMSSLLKFQPVMGNAARGLILAVESVWGKRPVDCLILFRHFTIEVIMSILFGCHLDVLKDWSAGREVAICEAIGDFPLQVTLRGAVPSWLWYLACKFPNQKWQKIVTADTTVVEFAQENLNKLRHLADATKDDGGQMPLILRLLQYRDPVTGLSTLREKEIIAEAVGHTIAGTDTTAISLSYLCWELGRRPDIAARLTAELDGAMDDPTSVPDMSVLQSLPYLNAFVKEGLRIYGAGPSLLERVVPSAREPFNIAGYTIPAGTRIATQSWSLHRDPIIFASPEKFDPERWLAKDTSAMTANLNPFGFGMRICGGQNLAQIMLRIGVAVIARNFRIEVPPETTEKSMAIRDAFVIFPAAMECKVRSASTQGRVR